LIREPQDLSLAQQIGRAFWLFGGVLALLLAVTSLAYVAGWVWIAPELDRSALASRAEGAALAAMLEQEDSLRGFLATHEIPFLDRYNRAKARLARANEDLVASSASVVELGPRILDTRLAEERWSERWAQGAAETPPNGIGPSMAEGTDLFDTYRSKQAALADAIDKRTEVLSRRAWRGAAARTALTLAAFVGVFFVALRQHRALRDALILPVAGLLRDIGHVRDGQLPDVVVDRNAVRELRELGQGLHQMVHALAVARELAESRDELVYRHSGRLRQVLDASREFSESLNLDYVVRAVKTSTAALGGYQQVLNADEIEGTASPDAMIEFGNGLAGRAVKSGRTTLERPEGQLRFTDNNKEPIRAIAIPLIVGARVVGALEARTAAAQVITSQAVEVLEMLALHAATAIESARLHQATEARSQMDSLTRLFNRRRLEEDLDAECKRCARYGRPLAFVMLDVDHFKAFNDAHGHPQADLALQEVADVIVGSMRMTDSAYRYGGEEFSVLLRETRAEDAMHFAERLRQRIQQRFATGSMAGITASFGVAQFSSDVLTPGALVEAADAAMYESKRAGRNRVMLSSAPPPDSTAPAEAELEAPLS
jgi:diguanylate cyclase (GGDEF)-like protein